MLGHLCRFYMFFLSSSCFNNLSLSQRLGQGPAAVWPTGTGTLQLVSLVRFSPVSALCRGVSTFTYWVLQNCFAILNFINLHFISLLYHLIFQLLLDEICVLKLFCNMKHVWVTSFCSLVCVFFPTGEFKCVCGGVFSIFFTLCSMSLFVFALLSHLTRLHHCPAVCSHLAWPADPEVGQVSAGTFPCLPALAPVLREAEPEGQGFCPLFRSPRAWPGEG